MKKYTLSILSLLSVHYVSQVRCSEYDRRADATSSFNRAVEDSNSKRRDAINEWFDRFSCTQDGAPVKDPIEVPEHVRKLASDDNKVVGVTNADPEKSEYASSELTGHIFAFKTGKSSLQMVLMALPGGLYTLEAKNNALHAVRRYDFSQEKAFITLLNKGFIQPVPRKKLTVPTQAPPPPAQPIPLELPDFGRAPQVSPASSGQMGVEDKSVSLPEQESVQPNAALTLHQASDVISKKSDSSMSPGQAGACAALISVLVLGAGYSAHQIYKLYQQYCSMRLIRKHRSPEWRARRNKHLRNIGIALLITSLSGIGLKYVWRPKVNK